MRLPRTWNALSERPALRLVAALDGGRILDAPVRGHRLPGPDRADLAGRAVADREDEVERRRTGLRELVPALAAQPFDRQVGASPAVRARKDSPAQWDDFRRYTLESAPAPGCSAPPRRGCSAPSCRCRERGRCRTGRPSMSQQHLPDFAHSVNCTGFTAGAQHAELSSPLPSILVSAPNTGIWSSVWNVSHAMPCGSLIQYLSDFA